MKYRQPYGAADNASYVNGNPATGTRGSILDGRTVEEVQREILEVITHAGLTPNYADLTQLRQAITALIAAAVGGGGGGGGGGGPYLLLAGGSMDLNADVTFSGTGDPMKAGAPYWHPSNDGADSGLDADLLDGINSDKFVRNDTDIETIVNGAVAVARDTANGNRGIVRVKGRAGQPGGGRLEFYNGAGDVLNALLYQATDRRSVGGQMYSDNGVTFEDQFRFTDDGDLWLRKLNAKIGDIGRIHYGTATGTNALVVAAATPEFPAYYAGQVVITKLVADNTGAMTINVNGKGVKDIKLPDGSAVKSGMGKNGAVVVLVYDGTNFQAPMWPTFPIWDGTGQVPVGTYIQAFTSGSSLTFGATLNAATTNIYPTDWTSGGGVTNAAAINYGTWRCLSSGNGGFALFQRVA